MFGRPSTLYVLLIESVKFSVPKEISISLKSSDVSEAIPPVVLRVIACNANQFTDSDEGTTYIFISG